MAAQFAVDLIFGLKGDGKIRQAADQLQGVDSAAKKLNGRLRDSKGRFIGAGQGAAAASGGVKTLGAAFNAALGPLGAALAGVAGLTKAFQTLSAQDFAEAKVRSLGTNSDELVARLKQVSKELGGQASVAELTGAAYDVASAGFTKASDAAMVLKAASLGATGGFSDINTVGNAATSVLNAYGLAASDAGRLVDRFIQTQNDGKIVVAEYAQNIGKVASSAAALGVPLEELNAIIAQSTASGNNAEVAFTGLKTALARLASGDAAEALKGSGIEISAASIKAEGLIKTLEKLKNLDAGQVFKALGTEAGPALQPILNDLERTKELLEKQQNSAGAAAAAQKEAANTIQGAWKAVSTQFANLFSEQSALGEVIKVTLFAAAGAVKMFANTINALLAPLKKVIETVSWIAGSLDKAFDISGKIADVQAFVDELTGGLGGMTAEIEKQEDAYDSLRQPIEDAKEAAKELKEAQDAVTKAIQAATAAADQQAQVQTSAVDGMLQVTKARLQAEMAVNQVLLDQAQRQLQAATSQEQRVKAAQQIYDLTVRQAELEYQATSAAIEAEARKSDIALENARLKEKEVEAVVRLAQAQGAVNEAHYAALAAQREAVGIAGRARDTAWEVAAAQEKAAQAVYQGKVNAAQAAYETNRVAKSTQAAASAAGQFASNMKAGANAANDAAGAILRSTEAVSGGRLDPGGQFGAAGRNAAFMSEYAEAFNKLQKEMLTMSISQSERASKEMMDKFMRMAEEYNRKAAAEANRRAMEEWNKYMPGQVGSQSMRQAVARDSLSSAMNNYGASSRSGGGSPQVNIAYQGSTVQMPDGNSYIKTSDANGIVGQAVRQTISTLGRDPAARRTAGIA